MSCTEFLNRYSEFIDHRLSLPEVARIREHMRECDGCARYHRVMTRGRGALDELPYVEPSADFYVDMRRRLASEKRGVSPAADHRSGGPGVLVALGVAAVLVAIVWSPLLESEAPTVIELPAMSARAPEPVWRMQRRDAWLPSFTPVRGWLGGTRAVPSPTLRLRTVVSFPIPSGSTELFTPIQLDRPRFLPGGETGAPSVRPATLSTRR